MCQVVSQLWEMEVIVKLRKTNTMTNTWVKTKTETDKEKGVENKRITVQSSNLAVPFCDYILT